MGGTHQQDDPLNFLSSNSLGVGGRSQLTTNVYQRQEKAQVVKLFSFKPFSVVYAWLTWSKGQGQHLLLRFTPTLTPLPSGKHSNRTGAASPPRVASGLLNTCFYKLTAVMISRCCQHGDNINDSTAREGVFKVIGLNKKSNYYRLICRSNTRYLNTKLYLTYTLFASHIRADSEAQLSRTLHG